MRTQSAEIAQQGSKLADSKAADAKPADDMPLRRVVAAALLDVLVRTGDPYPAALVGGEIAGAQCRRLEAARSVRGEGRAERRQAEPELLTLVPKLSPAAQQDTGHDRFGHRRAAAGGRRQAGPDRAHRRRRQRSRRHRRAGHRGGAAQRFQRGAARVEDVWRRPIAPRRKAGSKRPMRATPRLPRPVNSRPTPWRRSPNRRNRDFDDPDHSVSAVDRAGSGRRGLGCRADRRRRAVVGRLARRRPRCRCSCWRSASPSSRR